MTRGKLIKGDLDNNNCCLIILVIFMTEIILLGIYGITINDLLMTFKSLILGLLIIFVFLIFFEYPPELYQNGILENKNKLRYFIDQKRRFIHFRNIDKITEFSLDHSSVVLLLKNKQNVLIVTSTKKNRLLIINTFNDYQKLNSE
jgi:hypothetical protein